jgi:hypothetical protein
MDEATRGSLVLLERRVRPGRPSASASAPGRETPEGSDAIGEPDGRRDAAEHGADDEESVHAIHLSPVRRHSSPRVLVGSECESSYRLSDRVLANAERLWD